MPSSGGADRVQDPLFVVPGDRRVAALLGGFVLALLLLVQSGSITGMDGDSMYQTAVSIVDHGSLAVPEYAGVEGEDGVHYSKFGIGLPLLSVVPYALSAPVSELTGQRAATGEALVASLMPVVGALTAVALFLLGRRLGAGRGAAVVVALGTTFCTYWGIYLKEFFSEPIIVLAAVAMAHEILRRHWWAAGALLYAAALVRPVSLVMVVPLVVAALLAGSRRGVVAAATGTVAALASSALYNWHRFGSVTDAGYRDEHFDTPILEGLRGLFLHTDKAILLFIPAVALAAPGVVWCWRRRPNVQAGLAFLVVNLVVVLAVTSIWHGWHGNWAWGPRLVLPGVVPLMAVVGPWIEGQRWRKALLGVLFVAGLAVNGAAYVVPVNAQLNLEREPRIGRQWSLVGDNLSYTRDHLYESPERALGEDRYFVRLWQVDMARVSGRSGLAGGLVGSALLGLVAAVTGWKLWRTLLASRSPGDGGAASDDGGSASGGEPGSSRMGGSLSVAGRPAQ